MRHPHDESPGGNSWAFALVGNEHVETTKFTSLEVY
jgi:hypothetical protein